MPCVMWSYACMYMYAAIQMGQRRGSLSVASSSFLYCLSEQRRLCGDGWTSSPAPSLFAYVKRALFTWAGWIYLFFDFYSFQKCEKWTWNCQRRWVWQCWPSCITTTFCFSRSPSWHMWQLEVWEYIWVCHWHSWGENSTPHPLSRRSCCTPGLILCCRIWW